MHHYFGRKSDLFVAALDIPVNPASILPGLVREGTDRLGERIVETMLTVWDAADVNPVLMVVRSLAEVGRTAELLREFVTLNVMRPLAAAIDAQGEGERQRAGGRGSQGEGERQRAGGGDHRARASASEPGDGDHRARASASEPAGVTDSCG